MIEIAFEKSGLEEYRLEKDFLLTQILRELAENEPTMVFKGGTSLSKGYKDIERFSEDIDVTLIGDYEEKEIKPLICEILDINTEEKELSSFKIKVQKRDKTITDKFFALCKHYLMGEVKRYARHFYDIYKVYNKLNDKEKKSLKENIKKVAVSEYENCLLEQKKGDKIQVYDMKDLLLKVCDSKKYEEDYNTDVQDLLYKEAKGKISFTQCTDIIKKIINEGYFDDIKYHFVQFKRMSVYKWDTKEKIAKRYTLKKFIKNELEENVSIGKNMWDNWKEELETNGIETENGKYIIEKYKKNIYVCGTGINESFATDLIKEMK